jgi:signal transduction histidine kinase/ActR/RegA family two-component response regulator
VTPLKYDAEKTIPAGHLNAKSLAEPIIDTVREPLLVLDKDLRVGQANASFYRHFRVKPEETVGQKVYDLGDGQWDIPLLRELLEKVLPDSKVFNDFEVNHDFGRIGPRTILLNARSIDNPRLILLAMEDITEHRQAVAKLREAKTAAEEVSRAKGEVLANMSHEIRAPMNILLTSMEHLQQIDRNPEYCHLIALADTSAKQLRALIDDILDFSWIETRRVELKEEPFDLRACVCEAVELLALAAREKNLRLEIDVAPNTPRILVGDPVRLRQVLTNLIGNAVKMTQEGEVRIFVQPRGDSLEFAVANTGVDISGEKRRPFFENSSRTDPFAHRQHGSTGLRLAISKGLVELMGGRVDAQIREGKGNVFSFTLPIKSTNSRSFSSSEVRSDDICPGNPAARILLAEDNSITRKIITMALARRGWQTETAVSGRDAIQKWEQGDFKVLLMDIQMPEIDGLEATRTIRKREAEGGKRARIIGLTAHTQREIWNDCLKAGMDRIMIKPVSINDLYSAIESCLSE